MVLVLGWRTLCVLAGGGMAHQVCRRACRTRVSGWDSATRCTALKSSFALGRSQRHVWGAKPRYGSSCCGWRQSPLQGQLRCGWAGDNVVGVAHDIKRRRICATAAVAAESGATSDVNGDGDGELVAMRATGDERAAVLSGALCGLAGDWPAKSGLRVGWRPKVGVGVFVEALDGVPAEVMLLRDEALAWTSGVAPRGVCAHCMLPMATEVEAHVCKGCGARHCSAACLDGLHGAVCPAVSGGATWKAATNSTRNRPLLLQRYFVSSLLMPPEQAELTARFVSNLMSVSFSEEDVVETLLPDYERLVADIRAITQGEVDRLFSEVITLDSYVRLHGVLVKYGFSVTSEDSAAPNATPDDRRGGSALFQWASLLNHSCDPLLEWKTSGGDTNASGPLFEAWTMYHVGCGEELTIDYAAGAESPEQRRKVLGSFGIQCDCARCRQ